MNPAITTYPSLQANLLRTPDLFRIDLSQKCDEVLVSDVSVSQILRVVPLLKTKP